MSFLDDDMSNLSVHTVTPRASPRTTTFDHTQTTSTVNDMSTSAAIEAISPVDPDRGELPNYKESQEEVARLKQAENTRRARELQIRWAQTNGRA